MSKLTTTRDNYTGAITITGKEFVVVVYEPGHVRISGAATVERVVEQFEAANVYTPPANPDVPSPRSKPTIRKRGAR
jgi:hypothetical protein